MVKLGPVVPEQHLALTLTLAVTHVLVDPDRTIRGGAAESVAV